MFQLQCRSRAGQKKVFIGDEELNFDESGKVEVKSKQLAKDLLELDNWNAENDVRKALGLAEKDVPAPFEGNDQLQPGTDPDIQDDKANSDPDSSKTKLVQPQDGDAALAAHRESIRKKMEQQGVEPGKVEMEMRGPSQERDYSKFDYMELRKFAEDATGERIPSNIRSKTDLVSWLQQKGV